MTTTSATPATATPFRFFDLEVLRAERRSPTMIRIVMGGPELPSMASAGRDQRLKLFFPHPGQDAPVMPDDDGSDWYGAYQALDPAVRGIMRTYTIRALSTDELTVDFAVHGDEGPASRWALAAAPGDRLAALAPATADNVAYDYRPPSDTDWVLLAGDESALPAIASILETLPAGLPVRAWIDVAEPADIQGLPTPSPDAEIVWQVRGVSRPTPEEIAAASLPEGTPYAWIAGESATVKAIRRHLVRERGIDRKRVTFSGYWRRGTSETQLLEKGEAA
ncbi:siderophore-interacting protein [Streptomyces sp. A7024]|uniref:Siderophore-interacting protein n=1 Tax=Streptomyces coryli TaxID=1128680 RepID=A0A6G4UAQ1_9ACTN|nr:siderophore-interacting protein [Streptomyces coryli]NGN69315.1 siderophore-interacting protein [Streptomyces coryli]